MANYRYKATNDKGEKIEGVYEASSREAVIEMIGINNCYPLKVEKIQKGAEINLSDFQKIKTKDMAIFARQFYTMLDAGSSINMCLQVLSEQLANRRFRDVVAKLNEEVKKGVTLSEAMAQHKDVFPNLFISMVQAGEVTGNMDIIMLRMASHYEKENRMNNKIKSAMIYPIVLGVVAIAVVGMLLVFVMPTFVQMFKSNGVELPASTKALLAVSSAIINDGIIVLLILIAVIWAIRYYFKTPSGIFLKDKVKLKIPIIRNLNEMIIVSRFTRTLSTVIASGITLVDGLNSVSEVIGNTIVQHKIDKVRDMVVKGEGLAKSMGETDIFPPMLISMINTGEESGSMDAILNKTADFYDEELETQIQMFTSLLEPLMIVVKGVVIGLMVVAIVQPMFGMYKDIK
ncbi:type II secretion system F family protein [Clostridium oryzae]|uniref:Type II secretion system protein F n=1 Tax=Clostridium oryzae TaxID=1450648 RepID=A0A1V4INZ6_9CLOT|nr:type II secretion system F family protein [Clostridium oryzae]OPJ61520.1 type II secretion system protein F [Clostridium oryzae]